MKRLFVISLALLLGSVWLVAKIQHDPGYVLISYGLYTYEMSVWVGACVFIGAFIVLYGSFSVFRRLINQSTLLRRWFSDRGYRRSQEQTTLGLIAFIEGNWQVARRTLNKAAKKSETPLLNYLIAARASHALNDPQQMKDFLQKAEQSTNGADIAVDLTHAELELRSGRYEQSLATLNRVRTDAGKHPFVLNLLKSAYVGLSDWSGLLEILPELRRYKVIDEQELESLELTASKAILEEAAKTKEQALAGLNTLWAGFPKHMVKNSELTACYAEHIMAVGGEQEAEKLIRKQLKKDWNKALIALYGKINCGDSEKQLIHAENWLKERNNDAALMLCLGRVSLRNSLWGKAREYFESSLKLEFSSEVCAELGRLLAHLGEHEKSNEYFQQGLMQTTYALPALPLPNKSISSQSA